MKAVHGRAERAQHPARQHLALSSDLALARVTDTKFDMGQTRPLPR
jgi:hypothetical protein